MTDLERLSHISNVARVITADAILKAFDAGLVSWEDYPELPEQVWAEITVRIQRSSRQATASEDFAESYGVLSALAEEV